MLRAEIGPIAVAEKARKNKVGTMLFKNAESYLRKRGIRRVIAKVKAENTGAREFFNRMGFTGEGFFKEYTRQGEDVVQLVKFI
jgi:ribosomal protein S18 acetylase RimI-like enzyme